MLNVGGRIIEKKEKNIAWWMYRRPSKLQCVWPLRSHDDILFFYIQTLSVAEWLHSGNAGLIPSMLQ